MEIHRYQLEDGNMYDISLNFPVRIGELKKSIQNIGGLEEVTCYEGSNTQYSQGISTTAPIVAAVPTDLSIPYSQARWPETALPSNFTKFSHGGNPIYMDYYLLIITNHQTDRVFDFSIADFGGYFNIEKILEAVKSAMKKP